MLNDKVRSPGDAIVTGEMFPFFVDASRLPIPLAGDELCRGDAPRDGQTGTYPKAINRTVLIGVCLLPYAVSRLANTGTSFTT